MRQRLAKMAEAKAMRLGFVAAIVTVGYSAAAIVRLRTIPRHAHAIAEQLATLECCALSGLTRWRLCRPVRWLKK